MTRPAYRRRDFWAHLLGSYVLDAQRLLKRRGWGFIRRI